MSDPMHWKSGRVGECGFTLMELLVTVAIIATLAALLLPTAMKQIHRAQMAACSGNLRQIGAGVILYASEHDNNLPYGKESNLAWSDGSVVGAYVGCPSASVGKMRSTGRVFVCPGAASADKDNGSYVANRYLMPVTPNSSGIVQSQVKMSSVRVPARTVLMLEGYMATGGIPMESWGQFAASSWHGPGRMPHGPTPPKYIEKATIGDTMNILFADGHVEAGTLKKAPSSSDNLMSPDLIRDSLLGADVTYALSP
jgi:prepilin-type N-terminal cleavage/methylation domain-containing protein/prepilin-type processing-associated H-X9-DG protein